MVTGIATPSVPGNQGWSPKESLTYNCAGFRPSEKGHLHKLRERKTNKQLENFYVWNNVFRNAARLDEH